MRGMSELNDGRNCWPPAMGNTDVEDARGSRLASNVFSGSKSIRELALSCSGSVDRFSSDHSNNSCCCGCDSNSNCCCCCGSTCCCLPTLPLMAVAPIDTDTDSVTATGVSLSTLGASTCRAELSAARGRCRGFTEVLSISVDAVPTPLRLHKTQPKPTYLLDIYTSSTTNITPRIYTFYLTSRTAHCYNRLQLPISTSKMVLQACNSLASKMACAFSSKAKQKTVLSNHKMYYILRLTWKRGSDSNLRRNKLSKLF